MIHYYRLALHVDWVSAEPGTIVREVEYDGEDPGEGFIWVDVNGTRWPLHKYADLEAVDIVDVLRADMGKEEEEDEDEDEDVDFRYVLDLDD